MNFFERQDVARKQTGRLVVLFIAAVAMIIAALYGAALLVAEFALKQPITELPIDMHLKIGAVVAAFVVLVVGGGSMYKVSQLSSGGGQGVAESLGGRQLIPGSSDPLERKVLNVVEEMAIASGTPVPPVFMMDQEKGINAFAAGFSPSDAVIGVTRGAAEQLTREQLQGVIAHEFSHILNGDMRLNIRLMGTIHGILIIAIIGTYILYSLRYSAMGRSRNREGGGAILAIIAIAVALIAIGFVGQFFGSLIKAAVSRQREFLADASAVQFTRNPNGIGGALKAIAARMHGSSMRNPNAAEASHMFFGQAVSGFSQLFATHPPLPQRIQRILPDWDGDLTDVSEKARRIEPKPTAPPATPQDRARQMTELIITASVFDAIGQPSQRHVDRARQLIDALPTPVRDAAREPYGARAVIYSLLLDDDNNIRQEQYTRLRAHAEPDVVNETMQLAPHMQRVERSARLPLIDLALPALRSMTADQSAAFQANVHHLVQADSKIELFEWVLQKILLHHLGARHKPKKRAAARSAGLSDVREESALLLTLLARVGSRDAQENQQAFEQGGNVLGLADLKPTKASACSLDNLDRALDTLGAAPARLKQTILRAAAATIGADRHITPLEAELFRAVADAMGVPVPPILSDTSD